jgi:hypothetical protein
VLYPYICLSCCSAKTLFDIMELDQSTVPIELVTESLRVASIVQKMYYPEHILTSMSVFFEGCSTISKEFIAKSVKRAGNGNINDFAATNALDSTVEEASHGIDRMFRYVVCCSCVAWLLLCAAAGREK